MAPRRLSGRKLLVASVGVATMNFVAACDAFGSGSGSGTETSGNLMAAPTVRTSPNVQPTNFGNPGGRPIAFDAGLIATSGNLMPAPPLPPDTVPPAPLDAGLPPVVADAAVDEDGGS